MGIKLLEDSLINKIAAGEVIERPASIVKELIENSIDAGAKKISVEIANGGIDRIEIEDDGAGISAQEIPLAFLRHATSKIKTDRDLFAISTLGFRGEALPSIASVSKMEVYTRQEEEEEGVFAVITGGEIIATQPSLSPKGTRILVKELFYNTPVRKEFLKTVVTEGKNVYAMVCKYSISRPDISFTFRNEKKLFFKTPGNGKLADVLVAIYGHDFFDGLVEISYQGEKYSLSGYVSTPAVNRRSRRNQVFFINNRPIRSPLLYKAVDNAYKGLLLSREYPIVFLNIALLSEMVDVNIHPQKSEVRFKDEKEIFRVTNKVLKSHLDQLDYRPAPQHKGTYPLCSGDSKGDGEGEHKGTYPLCSGDSEGHAGMFPSYNGDGHRGTAPVCSDGVFASQGHRGTVPMYSGSAVAPEGHSETVPMQSDGASALEGHRGTVPMYSGSAVAPEGHSETVPMQSDGASALEGHKGIVSPSGDGGILIWEGHRGYVLSSYNNKGDNVKYNIIGQCLDSYIVLEMDDKLLLIDQHAAQERIVYNQLKKIYGSSQEIGQALVFPVTIELGSGEIELLEKHHDLCAQLGFELEALGPNTIVIRAAPAVIAGNEAEVINDLLDVLHEDKNFDLKREAMISIACKKSVKAGEKLSLVEMVDIVEQLFAAEDYKNCPHGRPTIINFTHDDLDRLFKR